MSNWEDFWDDFLINVGRWEDIYLNIKTTFGMTSIHVYILLVDIHNLPLRLKGFTNATNERVRHEQQDDALSGLFVGPNGDVTIWTFMHWSRMWHSCDFTIWTFMPCSRMWHCVPERVLSTYQALGEPTAICVAAAQEVWMHCLCTCENCHSLFVIYNKCKSRRESTCWAFGYSRCWTRGWSLLAQWFWLKKKKIFPTHLPEMKLCYLCYPRWQPAVHHGRVLGK